MLGATGDAWEGQFTDAVAIDDVGERLADFFDVERSDSLVEVDGQAINASNLHNLKAHSRECIQGSGWELVGQEINLAV